MNKIDIRGIKKSFGNKKVLDGIDLTVKKGESLAIIGPSGCGKSTLLRLIIRLLRPEAGTILIDGRNILGYNWDELVALRQKIGTVFQSSALFDSLTVGENVAFGIREHTGMKEKDIKRIVRERLEIVGLPATESLMPAELSGGMQKRVSLARAMATAPEIILYDEPTTGLDPIMSKSIEDLMNKLHESLGITAIIVTHQLSTIYSTADRVVMMHHGKVIEAGTVEETQRSENPVIRRFVTGAEEENALI